MKNAIWLVAGGPMQQVTAKKIKSLGYHLIISDGSSDSFCRSLADTFIEADTFSVDSHIGNAESLKQKLNIKAVLTTAADCHYTVARLGQYLGIHHLDPTISEICRDKTKTRSLLRSAGIYQPESRSFDNYEAAYEFLKLKQLPYVIKATDNSGSRGFASINNLDDFTLEQFKLTRDFGTTGQVIIEEKLVADTTQISEASVETIWQDGKMYWINWVDRIFPTDLKHFPQIKVSQTPVDGIEIGHINPSHRPAPVKRSVFESIYRTGIALGMDKQKGSHVLKADIFFSTKGPVILEMTPRLSGGWDSSGSSIMRGADLPGGAIQIALGNRIDLDSWHKYFQYFDAERNVVVVSAIPENAKDCIGRSFFAASSYASVEKTLEMALEKLKQGDEFVPLP